MVHENDCNNRCLKDIKLNLKNSNNEYGSEQTVDSPLFLTLLLSFHLYVEMREKKLAQIVQVSFVSSNLSWYSNQTKFKNEKEANYIIK